MSDAHAAHTSTVVPRRRSRRSRRRAASFAAVTLLAGGLGAVAVAGPAAAYPATCRPINGNEPGDGHTGALRYSPQDINFDGVSDLVVGVPTATVDGHKDAGAVDIHYGTSLNGTRRPAQRLTASSFGLPVRTGARFGATVAQTNVDPTGDSGSNFGSAGYCSDLLIGIPGTSADRGEVLLAKGSNTGVVRAGDRVITSTSPQNGDRFGAALATSGPDVFVGAPGWDRGRTADVGLVFHLRVNGTASGSTLHNLRRFGEGDGVGGYAEAGDQFGTTLATDGATLVVGEPYEDVGRRKDAGSVTVLHLAANGTSVQAPRTITQNSPGIGGTAEAGDHFGAAVAVAADTHDNRVTDIAVGVPGESIGRARNAGLVQVLNLSSKDTITQQQLITQNTKGVEGTAETGDGFGTSVVFAGLIYGNGPETPLTLAVGAPGESLGNVKSAGMVSILTHTRNGKAYTDQVKALFPGSHAPGAPHGRPTAGARFGASLSALDYSDDVGVTFNVGGAALVIDVPGDDTGAKDAGAVLTYSSNGRAKGYASATVHDSAGPVAGERYGSPGSTAVQGESSGPLD